MEQWDTVFETWTILEDYGFSSGQVWMWELDYKEGWVPKNWCFWIVVREENLESPLDSKDIKPVHLKGNQSWIFTGRPDAETPILWLPDVKDWLTGKDPDAGKDWGQEEKRADRGWDGWMASLTQRTWIWSNSGREWWKGKPGLLQSMGLQGVRHDLVTEQQHTHPFTKPREYLKIKVNSQ